VRQILEEKVTTEELRGMLRLREAELREAMAAAATRLAQVEARLRSIESEGRMPTQDVMIKSTPAVRVAELSAVAASYAPEHIGPVIGPLYDELFTRLKAAGVTPAGPGIAYYEDAPDGDGIVVHAGCVLLPGTRPGEDFEIAELPAVERAATIVHRGPMDTVMPTEQNLARWIDAGGHRSAGYAREVYLECPPDKEKWVTELQVPLAPAAR
jgi:effector-binding domain-containing protein